jgi:microcompartment protein CcmL/EutN
LGDIESAVGAAKETARAMRTEIVAHVIAGPAEASGAAYEAARDFSPLIEQPTVRNPEREMHPQGQAPFAVGLIETQGFTAVFEAIDTALKTAAVEVLAREKLGGGYITVLIKGDVAAVRAAVEAGKAKVEGLGRLIAAHVIPSPSQGVLSLLPKPG